MGTKKNTKSTTSKDTSQSFIRRVQKLLPPNESPLLKKFIGVLYGDAPLAMLQEKGEDCLYGISSSIWSSFEKNPHPKVALETVSAQKTSAHTTITVLIDDKPFLVDSLVSAIVQGGYHINTLLHPVVGVKRGENHALESLCSGSNPTKNHVNEAIIYIELDDVLEAKEQRHLKQTLESVLVDVQTAVNDWQAMRNKVNDAVFDVDYGKSFGTSGEKLEIQSFLQWLDRGYFTFLGYREYDYAQNKSRLTCTLGTLKNIKTPLFTKTKTEEEGLFSSRTNRKKSFSITKTMIHATVHRSVPMDVISVKKFDNKGRVSGERQFFGLFTSAVYNRSVQDIPLLRKKASSLLARFGFSPDWHSGKVLLHILESFPRDELFQASEDFLHETVQSLIHLKERQRLALFVRRDTLGHMASCLIYVPRDRFNSFLREKFSSILEEEFKGKVLSFQTEIGGDLDFARVHFLLSTSTLKKHSKNLRHVEQCLQQASMSWEDKLKEHFIQASGPQARRIFKPFARAFSAAYQETFTFDDALKDIQILAHAFENHPLAINFYHENTKDGPKFYLKLYQKDAPLILSDILPILENMGVQVITEAPYRITTKDPDHTIWLHHFKLRLAPNCKHIHFDTIKEKFEECLMGVWDKRIENDIFNALVVKAQLGWRSINLLRAYFKYLKQINFPFEQSVVQDTLGSHPSLTGDLMDLFHLLFNPKGKAPSKDLIQKATKKIETKLKNVSHSNEDLILRSLLNLILSTLRTNYFVKDPVTQTFKPYISIKFDGSRIINLPLPRPAFEIFVYSPWVEAIHLRGGKVARGGLRWSSRPDFRKEILDLMKAQMVKNTVIVPVGAKGGFMIKDPIDHLSHEERQKKAIFCYQTMIQGMLDITDNIVDGKTVQPPMVRCQDGEDPYLVVAADKGTATFSDIANAISEDYGFWMGDAFASGGSAGYDHKKMGITARGAWVSVARHFMEMGIHVQKHPFTVVGVGDMSGDVFGNGMLLSDKIKLVGAFNHLHIFLDPNPDLKKSYKERERLFKLPRSTWASYNPKALSKGAMIVDRSLKSVKLTSEVKKRFGFSKSTATPNEIITRLLKWESDLLWFGGIGTFVKSSTESHEQAGDRINDDVRIDAADLSCQVIGEGANLGMTQRARIEFAAKGGRINTDAIDNSAGVDCSDHEVNIKILLQDPLVKKNLPLKKRNTLLEKMTKEVADLTLRNNYLQTQAISMIHMRGHTVIGRQTRLMRAVEKIGKLNRDIEYLPSDKALNELTISRVGLTRPEISVLLAYGKIFAFDQVMDSSLPDSPILKKNLMDYFPKVLQENFHKAIERHPLRREIIATFIANSLVNRMGPTFLNEMMELANATTQEVMNAYLIVRESFKLRDHWHQIEILDYQVPSKTQTFLFLETLELIERNTLWLLKNNHKVVNASKDIAHFSKGVEELMACIDTYAKGINQTKKDAKVSTLLKKKVPTEIAKRMGSFSLMNVAYCIINSAQKTHTPIKKMAEIFFTISHRFGTDWLLETINTPKDNNWEKRAVYGIRDQILGITSTLAESIAHEFKKLSTDDAVQQWCEKRAKRLEKIDQLLRELKSTENVDFNMVFVATHHLEELI